MLFHCSLAFLPFFTPLQYLHYVGDKLLAILGHPPAFGVKANPLGWLEGIASRCGASAGSGAGCHAGCTDRQAALAGACEGPWEGAAPEFKPDHPSCRRRRLFFLTCRAEDVKINLHNKDAGASASPAPAATAALAPAAAAAVAAARCMLGEDACLGADCVLRALRCHLPRRAQQGRRDEDGGGRCWLALL